MDLNFKKYKYPMLFDVDLELSEVDSKVLEKSKEILGGVIKHGYITTEVSNDYFHAYFVNLVILALINESGLTERYCVAESKRVYYELLDEDELTELLLLLAHTFGVKLYYDKRYYIHFIDYISNGCSRISRYYKAVFLGRVKRGWMPLTERECVRVICEIYKSWLKGVINRARKNLTLSEVSEELFKVSEEIRELWRRQRRSVIVTATKFLRSGEYPPCITALLNELKSGKNLPHHARFALATFLLNIGKPIDEVVDLFRSAPDFNERVTRYQVEHLAGLRGSRVKYSPYKCSNMRSLGLCVDLEGKICGKIHHPLQYYKRGVWSECV